MAQTDNTAAKQLRPYQFKSGQSGNPSGRPKGSKNKLGEAFIQDLYEHWQMNGVEVLDRAAKEKPADYLKVVASILPRDIKVSLETMSDKELSASINQLSESLGLTLVPVGTAESRSVETIELAPNTRKN
jgi:hypothetical protein